MSFAALPHLNAALNVTTAMLLTAGWICIRRKRVEAHRAFMIGAVCASGAFLVSYLTYHFGGAGFTRFTGEGAVRPVYFAVLISHTVLAAALAPLVALTLVPALRERFDRHRRIARWTLPIWLYVSVTGVVVYAMLYHLWPGAPATAAAPG